MAIVKRMCWPKGGGTPWIETQTVKTEPLNEQREAALRLAKQCPKDRRKDMIRLAGSDAGWIFEAACMHVDLAGDLCPPPSDGSVCIYCAAEAK